MQPELILKNARFCELLCAITGIYLTCISQRCAWCILELPPILNDRLNSLRGSRVGALYWPSVFTPWKRNLYYNCCLFQSCCCVQTRRGGFVQNGVVQFAAMHNFPPATHTLSHPIQPSFPIPLSTSNHDALP